ncbi:MAG: metalloregulator ArsR/SmtB family transcription factor [Thermoplasmata archaeon]
MRTQNAGPLKMQSSQMAVILAFFKAISDKNRLMALLALQNRELCICQLTEILGLAPSTVSRHMSVLKHTGIVNIRRSGKWTYYTLSKQIDKRHPRLSLLIEDIFKIIRDDAETEEVIRHIEEIIQVIPIEKCGRKKGKGERKEKK